MSEKIFSEKQKLENIITLYQENSFEKTLGLLESFFDDYPNNLQARNLYALSLKHLSRFDDSKNVFLEIIKENTENPKIAYIYTNIGNLYYEIGQVNKAITSHSKSIKLDPNSINSYLGLGLSFLNQGENRKAANILLKGLKLDSSNRDLNYNLAIAMRRLEKYKKAANYYSKTNFRLSRSYQLECLYYDTSRHNSIESFYSLLDNLNNNNHYNPLVASISKHSSIVMGREDKCNFCKSPFDFITKENLLKNNNIDYNLINQILYDLNDSNISKKTQSLLEMGVQSSGNIFNLEYESIHKLKQIIIQKVNQYRDNFKNSHEGFIRKWPEKFKIYGWIIIMSDGGKLLPHIHKEGWLSSSIYLKRPKKKDLHDGDIEFGFHGGNYPTNGRVFSKKSVNIDEGDMIMFPSSIFHSTIPFESTNERITLAFDIIPSD